MLHFFMMNSRLLSLQIEDPQLEVYILEFEPTTLSSWSNFFKPGEYDMGAYHAKKKKLEDHR